MAFQSGTGEGKWQVYRGPSIPSLQCLLVGKFRSGAYLSRRKQWASAFFEPFSFGAFGLLGRPPHSRVSSGNLINATAIGANAIVDASNKIRLGNAAVTVIEAQVGLTVVSDKTKKENFQTVDGEAVLKKISGFGLTSWNFIGQDPKQFRHYGPMAQEFFGAFGSDEIGTVGTPTTINSGDMAGILMIAVQALEKRTVELKEKEAQIADLQARLERLERMIGSYALLVPGE